MRNEIQVVRIVIVIRFYVDGSICIFIRSDSIVDASSAVQYSFTFYIIHKQCTGLFTAS